MRKLSVFLALVLFAFAEMAIAAGAIVTSVTGVATAQAGGGVARPLHQGDQVNQGDTVFTGAQSSAVLKFDDGQVAALTSNSRMTITAYQYAPESGNGNVLLSLISGGMRTITGLIGRRNQNNVAYRAATATIGIRGTDNTTVTDGTNVLVTVVEGKVVVQMGDLVLEIDAGKAAFLRPGQPPILGTIADVITRLPANFAAAINEAGGLEALIRQAHPGEPREGEQGDHDQDDRTGHHGGPQGGGAGGGGGRASGS